MEAPGARACLEWARVQVPAALTARLPSCHPQGAARVQVPAAPAAAASPTGADQLSAAASAGIPRKVVFFPSCVTRMMGPSASDPVQQPVHNTLIRLAQKAGYEVVIPKVGTGG